MRDQGWYWVTLDGHEGIAYCQHHPSLELGEYVDWMVTYLRSTPSGKWPAMTRVSSDTVGFAIISPIPPPDECIKR